MWHLRTCFTGGLGGVRLTVRLDDVKGPFQPKRFHDSSDPAIPDSSLLHEWLTISVRCLSVPPRCVLKKKRQRFKRN